MTFNTANDAGIINTFKMQIYNNNKIYFCLSKFIIYNNKTLTIHFLLLGGRTPSTLA
jgi:hypothetical protein